ncbi:MAG: PAS domain S-box protein [Bacteroidetes bacterium]|nr:PAS domain S-box protein [Bacteroidota bacterium]
MKKAHKSGGTAFRQDAEELLKNRIITTHLPLSEPETLTLIHELEVHQIELEMQNVELMRARSIAEEAIGKYTELYDFAPSGYFTLTDAGEIIELNLSGADMLGKERSYLTNRHFSLFVSREKRPVFSLFLSEIFRNKTKITCELDLIHEGNQPLEVHLTGIANETGERCFVNVVDITDRKQIEKDLLTSEKKYRNFVEGAIIGVYATNFEGKYLFANKAMCKLLEFDSCEELSNENVISSYKNLEDRRRFSETIKKEQRVFNYELELVTKKGKPIHVLVNAFISGEVITGMMMDVTIRKQAEENAAKKLEELQRFHHLTVRRELMMIELKKEVNELLGKSGQEEKYNIVG